MDSEALSQLKLPLLSRKLEHKSCDIFACFCRFHHLWLTQSHHHYLVSPFWSFRYFFCSLSLSHSRPSIHLGNANMEYAGDDAPNSNRLYLYGKHQRCGFPSIFPSNYVEQREFQMSTLTCSTAIRLKVKTDRAISIECYWCIRKKRNENRQKRGNKKNQYNFPSVTQISSSIHFVDAQSAINFPLIPFVVGYFCIIKKRFN